MDPEDIMAIMGIFALVVVPALAFTARFAMKPIVESIIQLRKGFADTVPNIDASRLQLLEREVAELRREIDEIRTIREFDHALRPGSAQQQLQLPKDDGE